MTEMPLSSTDRHNAMISYCFLAPFMLISRDERFSNHFVKIHARYALLIQIAFLILITIFIKSRNFSSMIIFGASWVHILLFLCFFILLGLMVKGMYRALQGKDPKMTLKELSWSSFKNIGEVAEIEENQKLPLILSHIPFLGTYLINYYGNYLKSGEKFGNWAFLVAALLIWLDSSLTLLIAWITLVTFWIVYQSVLVISGDNIRLIGGKLPGIKSCHIGLKSAFAYIGLLLKHAKTLPIWSEIVLEQSHLYETYEGKIIDSKLSIPIINLPSIIHELRAGNMCINVIDGIILDLLMIWAIYTGNTPLLMLILIASWWSYWQSKTGKGYQLPFISDMSEITIKIVEWKRKKSIPEITTHPL